MAQTVGIFPETTVVSCQLFLLATACWCLGRGRFRSPHHFPPPSACGFCVPGGSSQAAGTAAPAPPGFTVKAPSGGLPRRPAAAEVASSDEEAQEGSDWETASEEEGVQLQSVTLFVFSQCCCHEDFVGCR